jgi:hypothetical protein
MPEDAGLRELLGEELAEVAGAEVERWLQSGAAGRGTESGARLGARFTKVDRFELELDVPETPDAALRRGRTVLSEHGSLREVDDDAASGPTVSAVVPSGFWNMNPALVTLAVAPREQGARVRVAAYALEGLIKQRAARKAATRIVESLG